MAVQNVRTTTKCIASMLVLKLPGKLRYAKLSCMRMVEFDFTSRVAWGLSSRKRFVG